jgi:hypothetical protein
MHKNTNQIASSMESWKNLKPLCIPNNIKIQHLLRIKDANVNLQQCKLQLALLEWSCMQQLKAQLVAFIVKNTCN